MSKPSEITLRSRRMVFEIRFTPKIFLLNIYSYLGINFATKVATCVIEFLLRALLSIKIAYLIYDRVC